MNDVVSIDTPTDFFNRFSILQILNFTTPHKTQAGQPFQQTTLSKSFLFKSKIAFKNPGADALQTQAMQNNE